MPSIKIPSSLAEMIIPNIETMQHEDKTRLRTAIKAMIESAIDDNLLPADLPVSTETGVALNLSFAGRYDKTIRSLSKARGMRDGDAACAYLYAAVARGDALNYQMEKKDTFLLPYLAAAGLDEVRVPQTIFAENLRDCLAGQSIGLLEAGTGIGKTMGIIAAASERLKQKGGGRCVVAVPTIALLRQFAALHRLLAESMHTSLIGTESNQLPLSRVIVGRNEFVSVDDLEIALSDGEETGIDPVPIREWLSAGGPARGQGVSIEHAYLLASLKEVSPDFPIEAVRLNADSSPDDPGSRSYKSQFERDEPNTQFAEIIYCTHAMLSADVRRRMQAGKQTNEGKAVADFIQKEMAKLKQARDALIDAAESEETLLATSRINEAMRNTLSKQLELLSQISLESDSGLLPSWQHLVIDEAHAFESNMANQFSFTVSIAAFVRTVRSLAASGVLTKSAAERAGRAIKMIRKVPVQDDYDLSSQSDEACIIREALLELALSTRTPKRQKTQSPSPLLRSAQTQAAAISTALKVAGTPHSGGRAIMSYSPVLAYPQLIVGRQSVKAPLAFMWETVESAVCVSATLYLRKLDHDSASYSATVLNIPLPRRREFPVIRPKWTHEPVVGLWVPEEVKVGGRYWLRPPSRKDGLTPEQLVTANAIWCDEVAQSILRVYDTAAGGMLVLLSSYAIAEQLTARLSEQIEHLITGSQKETLHEQMTRFASVGMAGKKGVWLAVGGAWTGLDINGAHWGATNPAEDNILTDLVIPRLPFGLNRSMTHKTRIETNDAVPWELLDTTMRFKQGIGRLIRRGGLPKNRRIFVLDGRFSDPDFANFLKHPYRVMATYPIQTFNLPDECSA